MIGRLVLFLPYSQAVMANLSYKKYDNEAEVLHQPFEIYLAPSRISDCEIPLSQLFFGYKS
jgi:hypothetical protein